MIVLKSLFRDKENFKRRINSSKLDFNKTCLIRLYSSVLSKEQIRTVAKQIKDIIPISTIIGGSCCGVVYEGEHYETETLVIIEQFDYTEILAKSYDTTSLNVQDLVKTINEELVTDDTRLLHVLFGNHYVDINQFVDNFNSINSNVSLMGGATGEILSKNLQPYVVFDDKVLDDYVVVASISSKDLEVFTSVNTSVEPITSVYNIDKCDGENILNIEGMPALDWCKDIFDFSICQEEGFNNDILTLFPLVLEKDNSSDITRFIRYDENTEDISLYCSKLEDNIKFRIGYINPFKCVQRIYDICKQLEVKKLDNLFFYSCLFRKSFLGSCSKWEISPFKKQICGVFMMGEICSINNKNQFLNGSCCILGIGEISKWLLLYSWYRRE